ncbi:MAG: hypothetical protein ACJ74W_25545 [Pyrinomonadaceae bacterium]
MRRISALLLSLMLLPTAPTLLAQDRRQPARKAQSGKTKAKQTAPPQAQPTPTPDQVAATRDEFVRLTNEYKKSLAQLLTFYEKDVKQAEEKQAKLKELYAQGLISKHDLEASAQAIADAQAKVAQGQQQMLAADAQVAEVLVEEKALEQVAQAPPPAPGKLIRTPAYIRYTGAGAWSLQNGAGKVQSFFLQKFGHQLPVSAYGQTAVHNRLGFDHRNAMDVPLNPGSAEGQALMAYLRANAIPFFAFYMAIPGSATGPHIHIGMPSHRIAAPLATQ